MMCDFPETEARNFLWHVMGKPPAVDNGRESLPPDKDPCWSSSSESIPQWVLGKPVATRALWHTMLYNVQCALFEGHESGRLVNLLSSPSRAHGLGQMPFEQPGRFLQQGATSSLSAKQPCGLLLTVPPSAGRTAS